MRRRLWVVLAGAFAAVLTVAGTLPAQSGDSLRLGILAGEVGSDVRVSIPFAGRIEGRLLEVTPEMLRIEQATGPRTVPFSSRDTLWVKEPIGATAVKFGVAGGLAAAGGVMLFFRSTCGPGGDDPCTGFGRGALIVGLGGAVLGAGAGIIAGELIQHWVRKNP